VGCELGLSVSEQEQLSAAITSKIMNIRVSREAGDLFNI